MSVDIEKSLKRGFKSLKQPILPSKQNGVYVNRKILGSSFAMEEAE